MGRLWHADPHRRILSYVYFQFLLHYDVVITIHHRYRQTDRQTDRRHARSISATSRLNTRVFLCESRVHVVVVVVAAGDTEKL